MTNFEDLVKEIYLQMSVVKGENREPYYLFLSKENYKTLKTEMINLKADHLLQEGGRLDFFEKLEVVPLGGTTTDFIEVKGIKSTYAV
jgi:hypothetical protein